MAFEFEDIRRLAGDLSNASTEVKTRGRQALRKTALDTVRSAKNRAPVDTGNLKGSIGASFDGDLHAEIGPTADYGYWVEMGTSRMAPQPYLAPAADIHFPLFEEAIAQLGGEILGG